MIVIVCAIFGVVFYEDLEELFSARKRTWNNYKARVRQERKIEPLRSNPLVYHQPGHHDSIE